MRKMYKCMTILLIMLLAVLFLTQETQAKETNENVSVTVSSELQVVFREDGTNAVSDYVIENHSPVPIHVINVVAKVYNGWQLVPEKQKIPVDEKKLSLSFQGKSLEEGENLLQMTIPETESRAPEIVVGRGAWSSNHDNEKALELSVEYALGKKEFRLQFDGDKETEQVTVENGETVKLPVVTRVKYNFLGWEDEEGNLYTEEFVMPMRDVTLKAKWEWTEAYAIFTAEDQTLSFVRSVQPIKVDDVWKGKTVNAVYTGFEETEYTSNRPAPWREQHDAEKVIVYDVIQPKATAYWFYGLNNAYDFDLEQLDTSMVTVMTSMFSYAGSEVPDTVSVRGIKDWDVSKVKYFGSIFRGFGRMASVVNFEDISGWNTSSAISMVQFFCAIAENSGVYVDCSNWNVANVQQHWDFSEQAGGTIIEPHWN